MFILHGSEGEGKRKRERRLGFGPPIAGDKRRQRRLCCLSDDVKDRSQPYSRSSSNWFAIGGCEASDAAVPASVAAGLRLLSLSFIPNYLNRPAPPTSCGKYYGDGFKFLRL
jgi:hypothetical protein